MYLVCCYNYCVVVLLFNVSISFMFVYNKRLPIIADVYVCSNYLCTYCSKVSIILFNYLLVATMHDEANEDLSPFTEEDLALLYVNPQLIANQEFVENFIKVSQRWLWFSHV